MLSLLLKTAPLSGQAPHLPRDAPREVSAPLWQVTNFTYFAYGGAPRPA